MMTVGKRLGLTGAQRIILDEIQWRRDTGRDISVRVLADATNYHRSTVVRCLQELRGLGVLEIRQPCWGSPDSTYVVRRNDA